MTSTPYQFIKQGNLFIIPVGPSISEVQYPNQSFTRPPDYSLWLHGKIHEPGPDLDHARLAPRLYQEVRDDLVRYSPVEVTRSALRRSDNQHAYVGVIDSRGTPYYFAFDSRGLSVREVDPNDERVWKTFDLLADGERALAVSQRRIDASAEMRQVDRELSEPTLVITKSVGESISLPDGRAKHSKPSDFDQDQLREGTKHELEHTTDRKIARRIAMDHLYEDSDYYIKLKRVEKGRRSTLVITKGLRYGKKTEWKRDAPHATWWRKLRPRRQPKQTQGEAETESVDKALPRKSREQEVNKTPSGKASKKQSGVAGRTRYTYPQEKQNKGTGKPASQQVPLVVEHDDTRHADPAELANQLGVSIRTLSRVARRLGRDEFSKFMRSHLKRFAAKHRLDPDYWGTLYTNIAADPTGVMVKSDEDAWKQFGHNVNATARSVPADHPERSGDRKVFIHHVHHEMKQRGLYHGNLDEFKNHLVHAHKKGHVDLSRADFVQAMNPHSVKQSNTETSGATFNFINNVKHVPEQIKNPEAKPSESGSAHESSQRANAATAHAEQTKTPEAHLAAMTAHHQAGVAHQKATGKISNKTSLKHFSQSIAHLNASKAKT